MVRSARGRTWIRLSGCEFGHDAAMRPAKEEFASLEGIRLCYETFGDESRPALLLVMGLGTQMIGWHADFCSQLAARGFFVVRYDNRDVGRSTHLVKPRSCVSRSLGEFGLAVRCWMRGVSVPARRVAAGRYEARLRIGTPGTYRVQLESEQANLGSRAAPGGTRRVTP